MSLAKFSVDQAIFVNLLFLVFLAAGLVVYFLLPVDVYPDLSLDEAWIQTTYAGASPEIVEQDITEPIEKELKNIPGVARITSNSVANFSHIFVKFSEDLDPIDYEAAFQEVRNRLDRVPALPSGAEEPLLTRLTVGELWPIVQVVIADEGYGDERVIREVTRNLARKLEDIPGISKIKEIGLRDREIHILVDKYALEQYQVSLSEVAGILTNSNRDLPGGTVQTSSEEFAVIAAGQPATPEEIGRTIIRQSPTGDHVYVDDIATIQEDYERRITISRYMGKKCGFLYVAKKRHADSITVRNAVDEAIARYRETSLPQGVSVSLFADSTLMISSRLGVLKKNLGIGLVLVFCVLWMIIGVRNSILAVVGIPFSFLCAFIFMWFIDVSINAVSVFALVLISGMIVDDAIVVLENIYRHVQEGRPIREAVIEGTNQVILPVVTSALTTVAAFLPLLLMTGMIGRFFSIIPKTVTVTLLASLFECLVILPNHYLHWGPRRKKIDSGAAGFSPRGLSQSAPFSPLRRSGSWIARTLQFYLQVVEQAMARRYLCLSVLAALALCAYQGQRTLAIELFPSDFPTLVTTYSVAPGASLEQTDEVSQKMMHVFGDLAEKGYAKAYSSTVGFQVTEDNELRFRPNLVQIITELRQRGNQDYDPERVIDETRRRLSDFVRDNPQLNIENLTVWAIQDGPPIGKPVAIRIEHPDYEVAKQVAGRIEDRLRRMVGVFDIGDNLDMGQRELRISLKEAEASEFGLTFADVFRTLAGANDGFIVGTFNDLAYAEDLDIRLKYQEQFRSNEDQLLNVNIKSPTTQALLSLSQVAHLQYRQGYANHYRHNGKRAVLVTADVDSTAINADRVNRIIMADLAELDARDDQLTIVAEGQFMETRESFRSLMWSGLVAVALMYLILAAQFNSYLQPLIVLSSLVFGTIGMVMGLVVNNYPLSVITGIAMVGLFGIMVNDAILLVSFINGERARGAPVHQAVIYACKIRLRPIMLTTVTTVIGLLPMAMGVGGYSKIWSPFATCICWGLTAATILILVMLPAFYLIVEDLKSAVLRLSHAMFGPPEVEPSAP